MGSDTHEEILERSKRLSSINDTINLNDQTTLDDRLGELLHLSAMLYHQNYNQAIRKIAPLNQVVDVRDVSEIIYLLTVNVDYIFGVPKRITPVGITADLDRDTHLVIPVDGDLSRRKPYMQLISSQSSYLEHSVTEKMYKTEAISAVKGIQMAKDLGIPVHTITKQNITTILPLLQLSFDLESEIQNAINSSQEVIVPERNLTYFDWTGVGYIIQDPLDGDGAYRISGGFGGAVSVSTAYIFDLAATIESDFAQRARDGAVRPQICYPGLDNNIGTEEDICYTVVAFEEIDPAEQQNCADSNPPDPGCRDKYWYPDGRVGIARPLIDIHQYGAGDTGLKMPLTEHIKAGDWQSQDGARYMRAGIAILTTIEALMKYFKAAKHGIISGYRTHTHNISLTRTNPRASDTSHHMDGVAADFILGDFQTPIIGPPSDKCQIMEIAKKFVGGRGAVKDEGTASSVHTSIPTAERDDVWNCP